MENFFKIWFHEMDIANYVMLYDYDGPPLTRKGKKKKKKLHSAL